MHHRSKFVAGPVQQAETSELLTQGGLHPGSPRYASQDPHTFFHQQDAAAAAGQQQQQSGGGNGGGTHNGGSPDPYFEMASHMPHGRPSQEKQEGDEYVYGRVRPRGVLGGGAMQRKCVSQHRNGGSAVVYVLLVLLWYCRRPTAWTLPVRRWTLSEAAVDKSRTQRLCPGASAPIVASWLCWRKGTSRQPALLSRQHSRCQCAHLLFGHCDHITKARLDSASRGSRGSAL